MDIITVNVGQGSLSIVRNGSDALVIDACMPCADDSTVGNVKRYLASFLKDHCLRGIMLTGFDEDHADVRCLALVVRKYRPEWVLYPDYDKGSQSHKNVMSLLESERDARAGSNSPLKMIPVTTESIPNLDLNQLIPGINFELFSPCKEDMDCSNNSSVVVKITGEDADGFSYLVTGDTENTRWRTINKTYGTRLRADVMAAPHHGSRDANNGETLLLVNPDTIVISAGCGNSFGHPNPGVVAAYMRVARHVCGTHCDGGQSLHTKRTTSEFRTIAFTA